MTHPNKYDAILKQLSKPHSIMVILALSPDTYRTATEIYRLTLAPTQTAMNRLNELIKLGLAIEKKQPPNTRRRQIKLHPRYTRLQELILDTQQEIGKELALAIAQEIKKKASE